MARNFHQGIFTPRNPEKYKGDVNNIVFRSGWEKKVFIWCDTNPNILSWASEEFFINYISPVDGKLRRYFPDLLAKMQTRTGIIDVIIEIKPKAQTVPPKKPSRVTKRYLEEIETYAINISKWKAATTYAEKNGMTFKIITEDHIGT